MMNIAFALYDSSRDAAKLTDEQKQRKLDKVVCLQYVAVCCIVLPCAVKTAQT